ncbi:carbohydrate kinase family protein [Microbacterium aurum]
MSGSGRTRVRVLGNLNHDLLLTGVDELPQWGRETLGESRSLLVAGQAGYIASALGHLGATTAVCGVVGDDTDGAELRHALEQLGVDVSGVHAVSGRTGLTIALIRADGERAFVSDLGVSALATREMFLQFLTATPADYTIVAGTSNTPNLKAPDLAAVFTAAAADSRVVFDPGWDPDGYAPQSRAEVLDLLALVDLYLPNEDEARAVTGGDDVEDALRMLDAATRGHVVVKRGAEGSVALIDDVVHHVATRRVRAANAVGAGDTYDAALVVALGEGRPLAAAMEFASAAAAHFVERAENRYPRLSDLA